MELEFLEAIAENDYASKMLGALVLLKIEKVISLVQFEVLSLNVLKRLYAIYVSTPKINTA